MEEGLDQKVVREEGAYFSSFCLFSCDSDP